MLAAHASVVCATGVRRSWLLDVACGRLCMGHPRMGTWGDMTVLYSAEAGLSLLVYVCVFVIWLSRVCVLAVDRESECAVATRVRRRDEHHAVCESQSRGRL